MTARHAARRRVRSVVFSIARPSIGLIGPIAVVLMWWLAASANLVSEKLLPSPWATFDALGSSIADGDLWADLGPTVKRTLQSFGIAVVGAVPLGIVLGANRTVYRGFESLIDFFRSTPVTALFPLFLLIFGIGDEAKVAVAVFAAGLIILFNVAYGVIGATRTRIMAARAMGASHLRVLKDVLFFEALPQTFVGLRTGVSLGLVVIIVAEMFVGADNGMGKRIIDAQQVFDLSNMYASILVTGVLGYVFNRVFLSLDQRVVHWSGR